MSQQQPQQQSLTLEQAMRLAVQHHQAGRLREAEGIYRQILAKQPNHPDALHLLGVMALQANQPEAAIDLIRRAIVINPNAAGYLSNLGTALSNAGRLEEALAAHQRAVALTPNNHEVLNNLADVLCRLRRFDEALGYARRAVAIQPDFAHAHNNVGIALMAKELVDEAIPSYRRAVELQPAFARAWCNLGNALARKKQWGEAAPAYERAIGIQPDLYDAQVGLGTAAVELGRNQQAINAYRRALELRPDVAETHNNLGVALHAVGQVDLAAEHFQRAVALKDDYPDAHYNLATALQDKCEWEQAIAEHRRTIELRPDYAKAYNNLGTVLRQLGRLDEAIAAVRQGLAIWPDWPLVHHNLGLMLLLKGDFANGWREQDWRKKVTEIEMYRQDFPQPEWDGGPLGGKRLLLHTEQGFGDAIQFIRYTSKIPQPGGRVILQCQKELVRLFGQIRGVDQIVERGKALPEFEVQCSLLSLPMLMKTDLGSIPADVPYLRADEGMAEKWSQRLPNDRIKVGLVWAGRPTHKDDRNRSMQLQTLAPLAEVANVCFVSLQKSPVGSASADRLLESQNEVTGPLKRTLLDWTDELRDFADTAALIENLDLVISVDTSVAHVAGAVGKPVWVLLPFVPDWRWLLDRNDSPWYPTMRLFRQRKIGDWQTPVAEIVQELANFKIPAR